MFSFPVAVRIVCVLRTGRPVVTCHDCGAPFAWQAPGASGRDQRWRRVFEHTKRGARCADRNACKRRKAEGA